MIRYRTFPLAGGSATVGLSEFRRNAGAPAEYNAIAVPSGGSFEKQWGAMRMVLSFLHALASPVSVRIFLSDPTNQCPLLSGLPDCPVSVVGQAPMLPAGSKIALWVWMRQRATVERIDGRFHLADGADGWHEIRGGYMSPPGVTSYEGAVDMLSHYSAFLRGRGASLAANCMRTWFYVRDIDLNYAGMVRGRNEVFAAEGLTPATHFIASTGIEGEMPDCKSLVGLDTYAIVGGDDVRVEYLKGASHLNATSEYGVAFERATLIESASRRCVMVSGTASIDNKGAIVHPGDIVGQTLRMCANVEVLLAEGGCTGTDISHAIVYVRDPADAATVHTLIAARYPGLPFVVVLAPVCRPGWLVEMECMALR